jgi:ABC-type oligopeptide transport system substrate-binding subunit
MKKIIPSQFTLMVALLSYSIAPAAPQDTVVIAQGVDTGTLDPQNHYETPAFNVLLNVYETLLVRNDEMKLNPIGYLLEADQQYHLGIHPAQGQVPQWEDFHLRR